MKSKWWVIFTILDFLSMIKSLEFVWVRLSNGVWWPAESTKNDNLDLVFQSPSNLKIVQLFGVKRSFPLNICDNLNYKEDSDSLNIFNQSVPSELTDQYNCALYELNLKKNLSSKQSLDVFPSLSPPVDIISHSKRRRLQNIPHDSEEHLINDGEDESSTTINTKRIRDDKNSLLNVFRNPDISVKTLKREDVLVWYVYLAIFYPLRINV